MQTHSKADYAAYIASDDWAAKRRLYWASTDQACARCGTTDNLHVHHMTYERFGNELLSDLLGLCQGCHTLVHEEHRRLGGNLMQVTLKVVKQRPVKYERKAPPPFVPKHLRPGGGGWDRNTSWRP